MKRALPLAAALAFACNHPTGPKVDHAGQMLGAPDASDWSLSTTGNADPQGNNLPTTPGTAIATPPGSTYAPVVDPTSVDAQPVDHLVAAVSGTPDHPEIHGTVSFRRIGDRVEVQTDVQNLPIGTHGYHVHLFGDCSKPAADSAGPHLDFRALTHSTGSTGIGAMGTSTAGTTAGSSPQGAGEVAIAEQPDPRIVGNLGELTGAKGRPAQAATTLTLPASSLGALTGRAVVIHSGPNDPKSEDGAAGTPMACGVIGVANDKASVPDPEAPSPAAPNPPIRPAPKPPTPGQ